MESTEGQIIRVQICQKCYEHQSYDCHSQKQYHQVFQKFSSLLKQAGFTPLRNVAPKYLKKAPNNKNSTKRYIDSNTGKIVEFPGKGTFQVYYKNILIYSKLQASTFPDLQYICTLIKTLKQLYNNNPCIINSFEKFRDIQFEWKKNPTPNESLYTFIKINSFGNTSEETLRDILCKLILEGPQQQIQKNKKKIVHPYSIYENTQKKQKMQSIYCPKPIIPQYLTHRGGNSLFSTRNFKKKQLRPQTSEVSLRKNKQTIDHVWTQRQPGTIVKNDKKNHIFQLVIKEQNKQLDKQKINKILKNESLIFNPVMIKKKNDEKSFSKDNGKNFRFHSNGKRNKTERQKRAQTSKGKQIYVSHLQNIKQNQIKNNNLIKLKFKNNEESKNVDGNLNSHASSITDRLKIKKGQLTKNQCLENNKKQSVQNLSSSRFGSIKKNILADSIERLQCRQQRQGQFSSLQEQPQMRIKVSSKQRKIKNNSKSKHKQFDSENQQLTQKARNDSIDQRGSRIIKNNSKCIKQSKYSKVRQSLQQYQPKEMSQNQFYQQNKQEDKNINIQQSDRTFNSKSNEQNNQNSQNQNNTNSSNSSSENELTQSRLKRASIEQTTVQKRIRQRKRSSNHERYPTNFSRLSKLNSLQIQIQNSHKQNYSNFVDQIHDVQNSMQMNENLISIQKQWEQFTISQKYSRQPAQIIKKFAQQQHFLTINSYSTNLAQILKDCRRPQVQFQIKGQQLLKTFIIKSIRQIHRPSQLRLFPQIFKQIEYNSANQLQNLASSAGSSYFTHNSNFGNNNCHYYKSKLVHVVNLMLRSNPMMISRIFQDKKNINPYGVYCIWLRNLSGRFEPVFVNDQFAFEVVKREKKSDQYKAIYSWLGNQNSIWFMLLEKAVAKILGGYQAINANNLAQLMNIIMGSPTVDIGHVNPQKALRAFDQKIFYNKMASLYTLRQNLSSEAGCTSLKQGTRVDRIIGFSYSKRNPSDSAVNIKVQEATVTMSMKEFLLSYGEVALLFFNNNYFLNQIQLIPTSNQSSVLSCRLICGNSKNNCYLMFSCFPQKQTTKVTLYKQLNDNQAEIRQGMNPLSEENRRYQYVGQICKIGNFFFQVQLNGGQYICLMESAYNQSKPFMSIFSQYPIQILEPNCNELRDKDKKNDIKKMKTKRKQKYQQDRYIQNDKSKTPKILIQQKINRNIEHNFYNEQMYRKYVQKQKRQQYQNIPNDQFQIRINKQYAYQPDNINDSDQNEKQNMTAVSNCSHKSNTKSNRNKKIIVVQVEPRKQQGSRNSSQIMKQSVYQKSVANAIEEVQQQKQMDMEFKQQREMSPTPVVNKNRIIDDYD